MTAGAGSGERTPLGNRLRRLIAFGGPIPLSEFMRAALLDPDGGYYARGDPFGVAGDFTTAPEISQLFGEILGAFLADLWIRVGAPQGTRLVEFGPGRGTLMADILRVAARVPGFLDGPGGGVDLVEASASLRDRQRARLAAHGERIRWHAALPDLGTAPALVVANEFLDALPIRQIGRRDGAFRERLVGLDADGNFVFVAGPPVAPPEAAPTGLRDGAVIEIRPEADALVRMLSGHVTRHGGGLLFVDYGYAAPPLRSTLQAVARHLRADPLSEPGTVDLTAHVDFAALARAARAEGAIPFGPVDQGDFLVSLGLLERAGALGADKDEAVRDGIRAAVEHLAGPARMGRLFKALAIVPPGIVPAGFDAVPGG